MFVLNMLLGWGKHQTPRGEQKGVWLRRSSRGEAGQANHRNKSAVKNCCSWLGFVFLPPHSFLSPTSAPTGSLRGGRKAGCAPGALLPSRKSPGGAGPAMGTLQGREEGARQQRQVTGGSRALSSCPGMSPHLGTSLGRLPALPALTEQWMCALDS